VSETIVLDASAVLALMNSEPGHEDVADVLADALLSAVNLAEVVSKLAERGMPAAEALADTLSLGMRVIPLDAGLAGIVGALRPLTKAAGLSLGDRCCLALAQQRNAVVVTCERAWAPPAPALGLRIRNVRPEP
jgi:PIN domain nuclease of toxin-antitoxin system